MDKQKELKRSVVAAALRKLNEHLAEYRERMDDLRSVTVDTEMAETASQTEGRRDADIELMNTIGGKIQQVQHEMELLDQVDTEALVDTVQFGSVVVTDKHHLLIATSVDEFEVNGTSYLGLSTRSPLYQALAGKKAGEAGEVNGVKHSVVSVH